MLSTKNAPVVHVRFDGRSIDIPIAQLPLGISPGDEEIKRAVAFHLEVHERRLNDCFVDRHPNGNLTIRPQAVFG